jgi:hypothetical protein
MICDPSFVLPFQDGRDAGYPDSRPPFEEAYAVTGDTIGGEVRSGFAVVFRSGYGDGTYNVYGRTNEEGRLVEVVIDMGMTDFHRAIIERDRQEATTPFPVSAEWGNAGSENK